MSGSGPRPPSFRRSGGPTRRGAVWRRRVLVWAPAPFHHDPAARSARGDISVLPPGRVPPPCPSDGRGASHRRLIGAERTGRVCGQVGARRGAQIVDESDGPGSRRSRAQRRHGRHDVEGTTAEAWDLTFAVNLRAHFLVTRSALSRMEPGGAVVFISSVAGLKPGSQLPAYDASKAGLFGLSRHVAVEGARRDIRANVVVPGLIDTPMGRSLSWRPSRARTRIPRPKGGVGNRVRHDLSAVGRQLHTGRAWCTAAERSHLTSVKLGYTRARVPGGEFAARGAYRRHLARVD